MIGKALRSYLDGVRYHMREIFWNEEGMLRRTSCSQGRPQVVSPYETSFHMMVLIAILWETSTCQGISGKRMSPGPTPLTGPEGREEENETPSYGPGAGQMKSANCSSSGYQKGENSEGWQARVPVFSCGMACSGHWHSEGCLSACVKGKTTVKVVPSPGLLAAEIMPLWRSTIFLQMASPIPVPS